jgi:hypothetical protein
MLVFMLQWDGFAVKQVHLFFVEMCENGMQCVMVFVEVNVGLSKNISL